MASLAHVAAGLLRHGWLAGLAGAPEEGQQQAQEGKKTSELEIQKKKKKKKKASHTMTQTPQRQRREEHTGREKEKKTRAHTHGREERQHWEQQYRRQRLRRRDRETESQSESKRESGGGGGLSSWPAPPATMASFLDHTSDHRLMGRRTTQSACAKHSLVVEQLPLHHSQSCDFDHFLTTPE